MALRIFNTLARRVEEFMPRLPHVVTMYTCGPTVYRFAHLGNLRSYLMADWIRRLLQHQGYAVHHVKNITDVGHMRQEMLERGEDKVIAAALAEGKTPDEIARFYTDSFLRDEAKLNILPAEQFPRATEHVSDMVELVRRLMELGYAYEVQGNVYFSVAGFHRYGALSGNTDGELLSGVRVEPDPLKRDPRDFTLWKAAEPGRGLRWPSPWGEGFPGWHIECSAMSMKYLGPQLDIHTGGVDNIFPHHEGEIAQSEAATGLPFVRYWIHGQHLLADGVKMAKSLGNAYTLEDIERRGFDPLAFRYLCLTARFNTRLDFTFSSLRAAQQALSRLRQRVWLWAMESGGEQASPEAIARWRDGFWGRAMDNLGLPAAVATVWAMAGSSLAPRSKLELLLEYDQLLGLGLASTPALYRVPPGVEAAADERHLLRLQHSFDAADAIRHELRLQHYVLEDASGGTRLRPMSPMEQRTQRWRAVSSSREVESQLEKPDAVDFSIVVVACNYQEDVQRCIESVLQWSNGPSMELIAVDNDSTDGTGEWLEKRAELDSRLRVIHTDHVMGDAAAKNIALRQSLGRVVLMLDTSTEATGDLCTPLARALEDPGVGIAGGFGLRTEDLRDFHEVSSPGEVDAMEGYCFAFRRIQLERVGWMPETFRFYRNLDIYYSLQFRSLGLRILGVSGLPLRRHPHRVWSEMPEEQREKLSRDNFRRILKRWGNRTDLLVTSRLS